MPRHNFLLEIAYPVICTLLFIGVYFFFKFKLSKTESSRVKSIQKRDINEAVETDSPFNDQVKDLKDKGIEGVEDRFGLIQRSLPVLLFLIWLPLIAIPYFGRLPSIYISLVTAIFSVLAGLALRPFLENLFSGIVISFFKSVKVGDTVRIMGQYGLIEEIGLIYTVIQKWNWERYVIPNSKLLQLDVENLTMNDSFIWAKIDFYVSPAANINFVKDLAIKVAKESSYNNKTEAPSFWVMGIEKDSIHCWLAAWSDNPSDAWELKNDMRTNILLEFRKQDIQLQRQNLVIDRC